MPLRLSEAEAVRLGIIQPEPKQELRDPIGPPPAPDDPDWYPKLMAQLETVGKDALKSKPSKPPLAPLPSARPAPSSNIVSIAVWLLIGWFIGFVMGLRM